MKRVKLWLTVFYWYVSSLKCNKRATLLTAEQTAQKALKEGKSLIRLGDGELNALEGIDVHYQTASTALQAEMKALIEEYLKKGEACGYLLCMPNEYLACNGLKLAKKRLWLASWARFRYYFKKHFDIPVIYGDAFLFAKEYEPIYRALWLEKDGIIFVHNSEQYAKVFNEKYGKEVHFIPVAAQNCYEEIETIVAAIERQIDAVENKQNAVVLISAGPCAKAIVYRLKDRGVQLIDTGHCWDDPLALRK